MSGARNMPPLFAPGDAALVEAARAVTSRLAPFYQHGVLGGVDLQSRLTWPGALASTILIRCWPSAWPYAPPAAVISAWTWPG